MSLPVPSTDSHARLDPKQIQAMDAPLVALTQQCNGDLRQLLFAFFSFLNRRTDFYLVSAPDDINKGVSKIGFAEGDAEKILLAAFRQFPLRRIPKGFSSSGAGAPDKISKNETLESPVSQPSPSAKKDATASKLSVLEGISKEEGDLANPITDSHEIEQEPVPSNMIDVEYNDKGLQIPVGNGGSTPRYKWTQTLEETTVLIGIPKSLRGRDIEVVLTSSDLSVKSKCPLPGESTVRVFVEGNLEEKIRANESTWTVEGGVMIVTLEKLRKKFWSTVIQGDEKIDTELVDSRLYISDYDEATQAHIRKVIFDQSQHQKGLPSSDGILRKDSDIPTLPPGVEYIDKKTLDDAGKKK